MGLTILVNVSRRCRHGLRRVSFYLFEFVLDDNKQLLIAIIDE